ncbi:hypothetical protein QAD02_013553 [Eretmocerus hayati]|uniref:Uncharacterized protein n=1 Tax=Eretmocerus hayati TaxID=131215 RepID=A0ACC2P2V2_9HYME|nr:hypothetical protein QAD02_013553 [Eretmocerus hayati]
MKINDIDLELFSNIESERTNVSDLDQLAEIIQRGGNVNAKNEIGDPLIYVATKNVSLRTVKFLLSHGAEPNCHNHEGNSLLALAVSYDSHKLSEFDIFQVLIEFGADINIVNNKNQNVLWVSQNTV